MVAYYNEFDPYAAQWLRNLIEAGHIADGVVDERSIVDVKPKDLAGYAQCHFFAGIGGWSLAARLAGWPDDRSLWTGSAPCQPFSVAGKGEGQADERHLWPVLAELVRARRPAVFMGEQVAAAVGKDWLDGVFTDLEGFGYACGAAVVPACAVDAPHRRDRLWFVADGNRQRSRQRIDYSSARHGDTSAADDSAGIMADAALECLDGGGYAGQSGGSEYSDGSGASALANADSQRGRQVDQDARGRADGSGAGQVPGPDGAHHGAVGDASSEGLAVGPRSADEPGVVRSEGAASTQAGYRSAWGTAAWLAGADGKARRFEPSIRLLAHGVPARVGKLRAYGNAIVPQVAAEVIAAYMETRP